MKNQAPINTKKLFPFSGTMSFGVGTEGEGEGTTQFRQSSTATGLQGRWVLVRKGKERGKGSRQRRRGQRRRRGWMPGFDSVVGRLATAVRLCLLGLGAGSIVCTPSTSTPTRCPSGTSCHGGTVETPRTERVKGSIHYPVCKCPQ